MAVASVPGSVSTTVGPRGSFVSSTSLSLETGSRWRTRVIKVSRMSSPGTRGAVNQCRRSRQTGLMRGYALVVSGRSRTEDVEGPAEVAVLPGQDHAAGHGDRVLHDRELSPPQQDEKGSSSLAPAPIPLPGLNPSFWAVLSIRSLFTRGKELTRIDPLRPPPCSRVPFSSPLPPRPPTRPYR